MAEVKNIFTSDDLFTTLNKTRNSRKILKVFLFGSIRGGFYGFAFLFTLILMMKIFTFVVSSVSQLNVTIYDVLIAFYGFLISAFINILSMIKKIFNLSRNN